MTRIVASVTNDLSTDQRLHKVCTTLTDAGYEVLLIGRRFRYSVPVERKYSIRRLRLCFRTGPMFYAAYNVRLFFLLLLTRCDLLLANDLDTLPANFLASRIKRVPIVYDSHEYFCGLPELADRPFVRAFWHAIERFIFPRLHWIMTVNHSVARLYHEEYGKIVHVTLNCPVSKNREVIKSRKELGLPADKKIILYQGSVNVNRGLEEAVMAMRWLDNAVLVIIGDGNAMVKLRAVADHVAHKERIILKGLLPFEELIHYTRNADAGLAIEKGDCLNYQYSLSNKLFDYISAELPVLSSRLYENEKLMSKWEIGVLIDNHDPEHIAKKMLYLLSDEVCRKIWKENLSKAKAEFSWERQVPALLGLYEKALN